MLLQTILNNRYSFKSFVYSGVRFDQNKNSIIITILPRKNGHIICAKCGKTAPGYDKQKKPRTFDFIPLWGLSVSLEYRMRRCNCPGCGVKTERVPWAYGKNTITIAFMLVLAEWAKSLSWKETAQRFHTSWEKVFKSIEYVVTWGLNARDLSKIISIGIDEVAWKVGHTYITLVYQIDDGMRRLLWVSEGRTVKTMLKFFIEFGKERTSLIKYICSDMWKPYLKVIKKKAAGAIHILDRFHIVQKINKAIDEIRANEYRQMNKDGYEPVLKKSRWCLLKRPENLTSEQEITLRTLLKYNLKSVKAYLLKEHFDQLWQYSSAVWAGKFIDQWTKKVMYSKIEPMKKIAKTIRRHKPLILNWFKAKGKVSTGVVEGMNNKIKVTMRKSYGFRSFRCMQIALYHNLGALPVPELTHKLC